ncbi:hypothetical protein OSB04_026988 [Centaurea solstitialis]|uniref:Uncharacterized protein n=1 Tax=Centaurea solstitialis TaxID=347529 RepID=A0AA38VZ92_9ASTR|nr:hypothetical protein OSB04_026988 [Centaurea solstitialis]
MAAPVHQLQQYYRLGSLDNCTGKWGALVDCLKLKTKRSHEIQDETNKMEVQEILESREKETSRSHIWSLRTPEEAASHWNGIKY